MFHFFLLVSSIFLLEHSLSDIKEDLYLGYAMKRYAWKYFISPFNFNEKLPGYKIKIHSYF